MENDGGGEPNKDMLEMSLVLLIYANKNSFLKKIEYE
jgi:hypothetical protein